MSGHRARQAMPPPAERTELWLETPIGPMRAVADATHLIALEFHDESPDDAAPATAGLSAPLVRIESRTEGLFCRGERRVPHALEDQRQRARAQGLEEADAGAAGRNLFLRRYRPRHGLHRGCTGGRQILRHQSPSCRHPLSSLHRLGRIIDRLRWWLVAQEMAAQARGPHAARRIVCGGKTLNQNEKARLFASLHRKGEPVILYNVWDAGSAAAVADAGASALATGSAPGGLRQWLCRWRADPHAAAVRGWRGQSSGATELPGQHRLRGRLCPPIRSRAR